MNREEIMFVTADQILLHLIGDYVLQSDYMASKKLGSHIPAIAHAVVYTTPFLILTQSIEALAFICITHFIIDRWRLARHVGWLKNFLAPPWIDLELLRCNGSSSSDGDTSTPITYRHDNVTAYRSISDNPEPVTCHRCGREMRVALVPKSAASVALETKGRNYPWHECSGTGYHKSKPAWLAVWLLIITDNTMHLTCNAFAIGYLAP